MSILFLLSLHLQMMELTSLHILQLSDLQAKDFDHLAKFCPNWERVCVGSGTSKRLYVRAVRASDGRVLCKTCA